MSWRLAFTFLLPAAAWAQSAGMSETITSPPPMSSTPPPVQAPPAPNAGMEPLQLKLDAQMPGMDPVQSPPPHEREEGGNQDENNENEPVVLTPAE